MKRFRVLFVVIIGPINRHCRAIKSIFAFEISYHREQQQAFRQSSVDRLEWDVLWPEKQRSLFLSPLTKPETYTSSGVATPLPQIVASR